MWTRVGASGPREEGVLAWNNTCCQVRTEGRTIQAHEHSILEIRMQSQLSNWNWCRQLQRRSATVLALLSLALGLAKPATGQVLFDEEFDSVSPFVPGQLGPQSLVQQGWIFRNQSGPGVGDFTWRQGPYSLPGCGVPTFAAQSGSGFLASDWRSSTGLAEMSNWAILPPVTGQTLGTQIGLHVRQQLLTTNTRIEVRYSPSGGTSTGNSGTDVGDFTQLLLEAAPPTSSAWQYLTAPIPGSGRLALRYFVAGNFGNCSYVGGIDGVTVQQGGGGPCAGYPVVPSPGQTVTWSAANSPHRICASLEIPVGAGVIVESGASVLVESGSELTVRGQLTMRPGSTLDTPFGADVMVHGEALLVGTAAAPILLTGDPGAHSSFTPDRFSALPGGLVRMRHVNLQTSVNAYGTGAVVADNVAASGNNKGFFATSELGLGGGHLALSNCQFSLGASVDGRHAYLKLEDCAFDNTTLRIHRGNGAQDLFLDGITALNHAADSCIQLSGGNFFLGPNNVLQNNRYPVTLNGGGLLDGSVLPTSGNANNQVRISIPGAEGEIRFGAQAIPYRVNAVPTATVARRIDVSPGAQFQMDPGADFRAWFGSILNLEGTPEAPIRFEPSQAGGSWGGLRFATMGAECRVEYVEMTGMDVGVLAQQGRLDVDNNLFTSNDRAVWAGQRGHAVGSGNRFFSNGTGIQSGNSQFSESSADFIGDGNPNWFEGNTIAFETLHNVTPDEATGNYWGAPDGPQHFTNAGSGDVCVGGNLVLPFESAAPSSNHPPVVRLERHGKLFEEGSRVWLTWQASDDDTITHFRILHAPHGVDSGLVPIASGIPASARTWEITVPPAPPASNSPDPSVLRVEAYDSNGQMGWDQIEVVTPYLNGFVGGFVPDSLPGVSTIGTLFDICGQFYGAANPNQGYEAWIAFDGDGQLFHLGSGANTTCTGFLRSMPAFSTDTARIMTIYTVGNGAWSYDFSDTFEVRPNPIMGDAPPQVDLTTNFPAVFPSGTILPIAWTASDDEGLRSFEIQATYNGGRTWNTVVSGLDGTVRNYGWQLPPSSGLAQLAVRVIARDHRFQNSSSTSPFIAIGEAVGTSFCTAVPNSTGQAGLMSATGSANVADNNLTLLASRLPAGFGIFVVSRDQGFTSVPNSVGNLCLSGIIGRYQMQSEIFQVNANGLGSLMLDLQEIPQANALVAVVPGDTWRFQAWHRDVVAGTATSNFTAGLEIVFN